jgi:cell division protein ZipA
MEGLSDATLLRIGIAVAAVILFAVILFSSRKKSEQGRRLESNKTADLPRQEPTLHELIEDNPNSSLESTATEQQPQLQGLDREPGHRPQAQFEKIVTVLLAARAGQMLTGPDLVVAAEKAGLIYGQHNIFHRLDDNRHDAGPIFSMANLVQPGNFDLREIRDLKTPGVSFFMTLPGPLSGLDAWDRMLPTIQRMAELLDAVILDSDRSALSRQRIAHLREELRAFDRNREIVSLKPSR